MDIFKREINPEYENLWNIMLGGETAGAEEALTIKNILKKLIYFLPMVIYLPLLFPAMINFSDAFAENVVGDATLDGLLAVLTLIFTIALSIILTVAVKKLTGKKFPKILRAIIHIALAVIIFAISESI